MQCKTVPILLVLAVFAVQIIQSSSSNNSGNATIRRSRSTRAGASDKRGNKDQHLSTSSFASTTTTTSSSRSRFLRPPPPTTIINDHTHQIHRQISEDDNGDETTPTTVGTFRYFLTGPDLGVVRMPAVPDTYELEAQATITLRQILQERFSFSGEETIRPSTRHKIGVDELGNIHIHFKQYLNELEIEGASIVLHFIGTDKNGTVFAINGDFFPSNSTNTTVDGDILDCETAMEIAVVQYDISQGEWVSECQETAVQGLDGNAYLAYKRMVRYEPQNKSSESDDQYYGDSSTFEQQEPTANSYLVDLLFADQATGALLAVHPQVQGAEDMFRTYDCQNLTPTDSSSFRQQCVLIAETSDPDSKIDTSDMAVNDAHNYAVDVYNFYKDLFDRDSIDDNGMTIDSFVHYAVNFANAFWDRRSGIMVYGDGDGTSFTYLSKCRDIVSHELSHGVTQYTSGLTYLYESGAVNEGFSDVMAAAIDRLYGGKRGADVWLIAEDCDIDMTDGRGARNMANPPDFQDPDHYANRFTGAYDYGGVHKNSLIMSKAFYLMVQGGTHPLSGVEVPPLYTNFDYSMKAGAIIFYNANSMCLTESSDFITARECTLLFANSDQIESVTKGWEAVGVFPATYTSLSDGVALTGLSGGDTDKLYFVMDAQAYAGASVTCTLQGSDGDPDLYVKFGSRPEWSSGSDCYSNSASAYEECTTKQTKKDSTVYITVITTTASSSMTLQCNINFVKPTPSPTVLQCKDTGEDCSNDKECCGSGPSKPVCDGAKGGRKVCKNCKKSNQSCNRTSQCCKGTGLTCRKKKCRRY